MEKIETVDEIEIIVRSLEVLERRKDILDPWKYMMKTSRMILKQVVKGIKEGLK